MALQASCTLPTAEGPVLMQVYHEVGQPDQPWVVATSGDVAGREGVLVRLHDACLTSEILRSIKCDCEAQLRMSQRLLAQEGGVLIYTPQEGRGIGLAKKIAAYQLQFEKQLDTVDANRAIGEPDEARSYNCVPAILNNLGIRSVRLLTNNPFKAESLRNLGVQVDGCEPIWTAPTSELCRSYVSAKVERMGHKVPPAEACSAAGAAAAPKSVWRSATEALSALRGGRSASTDAPPLAEAAVVPLDPLTTMRECGPCLASEAAGTAGTPPPLQPTPPDDLQPLEPLPPRRRPLSRKALAAAAVAEDGLLSDLDSAMSAHRMAGSVGAPFVTVSYAQGLDGSLCGPLGARGPRLLLSGSESMTLAHKLRAAHDAVLVGVGTLLADDPKLTVRLVDGRSPLRVVLDSGLRTPLTCQLLRTSIGGAGIDGGGGRGADGTNGFAHGTVVVTARQTLETAEGARRAAILKLRGAVVLAVQAEAGGAEGAAPRVCVRAALAALRSELGVTSVMVEGGVALLGSLMRHRLAHYMVVTVAPVFAGGLRPEVLAPGAGRAVGGPATFRAAPMMADVRTFALGDDVVIAGHCEQAGAPRSRL